MKKFFILPLVLLLTFSAFSESLELTSINASWRAVLPGKVVNQPQITSYGFAVMTDAKNLMAYSSNGKLIWEKHLSKANGAFFSVLKNNFILTVTNSGKRITLLNPDGRELWKKELSFTVIKPPFSGRDGRFYLCSENSVNCFGINGIQKWETKTPELSLLKEQELPDGSFIVFLKKLSEGKTVALRLSPFGELLEQITFAGEVSSALTTENGILITFRDGTSGLFDTINDKSTHKWLFQKNIGKKSNQDFFVLSQNEKDVIYVNHKSDRTEIDYINTSDGSILHNFDIPEITAPIICSFNDRGVLLADTKTACFYSNTGRFLWSGKMPQKNSREYYTHLLFTSHNDFVLFGKNWSANAYKVSKIEVEEEPANQKKNKKDYSAFYNINTAPFDITVLPSLPSYFISEDRFNALNQGLYGNAEQEWLSDLLSACTANKNVMLTANSHRTQKSIFETDTAGVEKMYALSGLFGTDTMNEFLAYFIKKEKNSALLKQLLSAVRANPYDPEGIILEALEFKASQLNARDELLIQDMCDTVGEICIFMGYSAIEPKGRKVLSNFMYPQYHAASRTYARKTLQNLTSK